MIRRVSEQGEKQGCGPIVAEPPAGSDRMWHWAFELSRVRKARKAAVTAISPIVEDSRCRLGAIPDAAWSDPYVIGFMVMLISIIARVESGRISQDSMSRVQCSAWEDITSMKPEVMAEELLLLSMSRNRDFEFGCQNAATFGAILWGGPVLLEGGGMPRQHARRDLLEVELASPFTQREDVLSAWMQFFDSHIVAHLGRNTPDQEFH
jgi:hypothetical protein